MIAIDGSLGEGGGQVLRTALSLSMITGEPLTITNIRAKRRKPGLMRQHLTAVQAAATVCGASTDGHAPASTELVFRPGKIRHGRYAFSIGTAGSATLVLQTILPALLAERGESELILEGGTHNPLAPPYDFLERAFAPLLRRMGADIEVALERYGFYPAGGGKIRVRVAGGELKPLSLSRQAGECTVQAVCLCSVLPSAIPKREARVLQTRLPELGSRAEDRMVESAGPGNAVVVDVACAADGGGEIREVFTAFGEKNVTAERVAASAASDAREYIDSAAAVGKHLADQLLLPMALAGGGEFTTLEPSSHTITNIEVIQAFLPLRFSLRKREPGLYAVHCAAARRDAL